MRRTVAGPDKQKGKGKETAYESGFLGSGTPFKQQSQFFGEFKELEAMTGVTKLNILFGVATPKPPHSESEFFHSKGFLQANQWKADTPSVPEENQKLRESQVPGRGPQATPSSSGRGSQPSGNFRIGPDNNPASPGDKGNSSSGMGGLNRGSGGPPGSDSPPPGGPGGPLGGGGGGGPSGGNHPGGYDNGYRHSPPAGKGGSPGGPGGPGNPGGPYGEPPGGEPGGDSNGLMAPRNDMPPAVYGNMVPTIKAELKPEQLPSWDGNHNIAVE